MVKLSIFGNQGKLRLTKYEVSERSKSKVWITLRKKTFFQKVVQSQTDWLKFVVFLSTVANKKEKKTRMKLKAKKDVPTSRYILYKLDSRNGKNRGYSKISKWIFSWSYTKRSVIIAKLNLNTAFKDIFFAKNTASWLGSSVNMKFLEYDIYYTGKLKIFSIKWQHWNFHPYDHITVWRENSFEFTT